MRFRARHYAQVHGPFFIETRRGHREKRQWFDCGRAMAREFMRRRFSMGGYRARRQLLGALG